jgi:M6 family metalloprotease-like protein
MKGVIGNRRQRRPIGLTAAGLILILSLSARSHASPPTKMENPPDFLRSRVFFPHAGYIRTIQQLLLGRRAAAQRGIAPRGPQALQGTRKIPVILVKFANSEPPDLPFKAADYQALLFQDQPSVLGHVRKTMTQYYWDVSYGKLSVTGQVFGWYSLPGDDTHYENNNNGNGPPFGELLESGLRKADQETDFGQFDNDGPDGIPNSGDDDGEVDAVFFIHPERGAECGGDSAHNIWSHSWHYSEPDYGHSGPFVTNDVRRRKAAPGTPPGTGSALIVDGKEAHILVEDYTIQPGLSCDLALDPKRDTCESIDGQPKIIQIGVFCHEYGHALGLPDLYDRTPRGNADSRGVGFWDLMGFGSYGGDGCSHSDEPVHLSAWCKSYLGWASVVPLKAAGAYGLAPVEQRGLIYRADIGKNGKEYFLIERRDNQWKDPEGLRLNWDSELPVAGVAIWHVDETVGENSPNWPFTPDDEGQNDAPSRPRSTPHSLVSLIQPDRHLDLENNQNSGDLGDFWIPGSTFEDDVQLIAGSRGYDGRATGIKIGDINLENAAFNYEQASSASSPVRTAESLDRPPAASVPTSLPAPGAAAQAGPTTQPTISGLHREVCARRSAASSPVERRTLDLVCSSGSKHIKVDFSSLRDRVEQITGLSLPAVEQSVLEDAKGRLQGELKGVLGEGVQWREKSTSPMSPWNQPTFEQIVDVGGKTVPLFEKEAVLSYDRARKLTAVTSDSVPPSKLHIGGRVGALVKEEAKQIVLKALGVPWSKLTEAREVVFLVDDDPQQGRVAFDVAVAVGEGQADLHVLLDGETHEILSIQ